MDAPNQPLNAAPTDRATIQLRHPGLRYAIARGNGILTIRTKRSHDLRSQLAPQGLDQFVAGLTHGDNVQPRVNQGRIKNTHLSCEPPHPLHHLVQRDRQLANPYPGGVVHRIRNRRRHHPGDPDLPDTLDKEPTWRSGPNWLPSTASGVGGNTEVMHGLDPETRQLLLAKTLQQSPSFLAVLLGPTYVFEMANETYLQLVGHRELIGKPVLEVLPEVQEQRFIELLDRVLETGVPFVGKAMPATLTRTPGGEPETLYVDLVYQAITDDISRDFARGMRGDLIATSTPGTGSTFTLSLPSA